MLYPIFCLFLVTHQLRVKLFHTSLYSLKVNFCSTPTSTFLDVLVRASPTGWTAPEERIYVQKYISETVPVFQVGKI